MITFFISLILSINNDDVTIKYLISAACVISAALSIKTSTYNK